MKIICFQFNIIPFNVSILILGMKIVSGLIDVARKVGIEVDHTQVGLL